MSKKRENSRGLTLVELLVTMGILSILVVASTSLFLRIIKGGLTTETLVDAQAGVKLSIQTMERFIRNAQEISAVGGGGCPGSGNSLTLINSDGGVSRFSVDSQGQIASNSVTISPPNIVVEDLGFVCERLEGTPDQVTVFITARGATGGGATVAPARKYTFKMSLREY